MPYRFKLLYVILTPFLALTMLAFILYEPRMPRLAQERLNGYAGAGQVSALIHARQPQNFQPQMSGFRPGSSTYYRTSKIEEAERLNIKGVLTEAQALQEVYAEGGGSKPLPYPPVDLWCAKVGPATLDKPAQVVFMAEHRDLYNADWVLHTAPAGLSAKALDKLLAEVGCTES